MAKNVEKKVEANKHNSRVEMAIIMFFILFFILQIDFSTISKLNAVNSSITEETNHPREIMIQRGPDNALSPLATHIRCDRSHNTYDICSINGPTVFDPSESNFVLVNYDENENETSSVEKVRPSPIKMDKSSMAGIKEVLLSAGPISPPCLIHHNAPALAFSAGRYTGNLFHDFNDVFIPLFITVNSLFVDQNPILIISDLNDQWLSMYKDLLRGLSKHPIIDLDNDPMTHCFPHVTVGLISHGLLSIDPSLMPSPKTLKHFRSFVETALNHFPISRSPKPSRPRLVLVKGGGGSGSGSGPVVLNEEELELAAKEVGFRVLVMDVKPSTNLGQLFGLINSSHAMIWSGKGLAHSLFLLPGSVLLQLVHTASKVVPEKLTKDLELDLMEYDIGAGGNLDMSRFKKYLKQAYYRAKTFMDKEG